MLEILPEKLMKPTEKLDKTPLPKKEVSPLLFPKNKELKEKLEKLPPENGSKEFFPILIIHIKKILNGMLS